MKLLVDHAIYVQKVDLEFFKYRLHSLPQSISLKIFESSEIDVDDYNKYDFFRFEDPSDIEFFKSIDWILDYNALRDLSSHEIKKIGEEYFKRLDEVTRTLHSLKSDDKDYADVLLQFKLLNYQVASLDDLIDFKLGLLKIPLPDEGGKFQKLIGRFLAKRKK